MGVCGTAFSFYNRNNTITTMLNEVRADFQMLQEETRTIGVEVRRIAEYNASQLQLQQMKRLKKQKRKQEERALAKAEHKESWMNWVGRKSGVVSVYRFFVPKGQPALPHVIHE